MAVAVHAHRQSGAEREVAVDRVDVGLDPVDGDDGVTDLEAGTFGDRLWCDCGHLEHGPYLADRGGPGLDRGRVDRLPARARRGSFELAWSGRRDEATSAERMRPHPLCERLRAKLDRGDQERPRRGTGHLGLGGQGQPPGNASCDDLTAHGQRERRDQERDQDSGQDPA